MVKSWRINNGWYRKNLHGEVVLCEITPDDFDPAYPARQLDQAQYGGKLPYRQVGAVWVFCHKRDYKRALQTLRERGFFA